MNPQTRWLKVTACLAVALVFWPASPVAAVDECDDDHDPDRDGLSDCVELEFTYTNPQLEDTDADGIIDGLDIAPRSTSGGSSGIGVLTPGLGADEVSQLALTVEIAELGRLDKCEPYWGNKWDPYISTAFVQLPGVGGVDFTTVGLMRGAHEDDRASGPLETRPVAAVTLPDNIGAYSGGLGYYPRLDITIGMKEHDTFSVDDIRLSAGSDVLGASIPIWTPSAGQLLGHRYIGSDSGCDGDIKLEWQSDALRTEVIAAVLGEVAIMHGRFVTADELSAAIENDDCALLRDAATPEDVDTGAAAGRALGTAMGLCSAAVSVNLAQAPQWIYYLDDEAESTEEAWFDFEDHEHPFNHALGPLYYP